MWDIKLFLIDSDSEGVIRYHYATIGEVDIAVNLATLESHSFMHMDFGRPLLF
jgi:hypothetical protein